MSACGSYDGNDQEVVIPHPRHLNHSERQTDYNDSTSVIHDNKDFAQISYRRVLSFKDFKGFKRVKDIHERYRFFKLLGKGSFGEVVMAEHIQAQVRCAIKIIKKRSIEKHDILVQLLQNELQVLEETVRISLTYKS